MESVNKRVIIIAVIMALITSFLIYVYIKRVTASPETIEYVNVYVAAKTMPAKYKITENDIKIEKMTKEYLNDQAVLNKADMIGKRLKDRIIEGEQILRDRLVTDNNLTLAFNIPEGMRAVSVNVNEQVVVGNLLKPGDYVDILATFQKDQYEDKNNSYILQAVTNTVIQNVQVLAAGLNQTANDENNSELPKTVTLAVTPQDAEKLVYASEFGILRFSLRPVGDAKTVKTEGAVRIDVAPSKGLMQLPK